MCFVCWRVDCGSVLYTPIQPIKPNWSAERAPLNRRVVDVVVGFVVAVLCAAALHTLNVRESRVETCVGDAAAAATASAAVGRLWECVLCVDVFCVLLVVRS